MFFRRACLAVLVASLSLTLISCDLLGSGDEDTSVVTSGVYVANAGAFGQSNSTLTIYDPSSDQTQTLPSDASGFTSYIQSLAVASNDVYLLFGETNSIGVVDAENTELTSEISGVRNPRYMTTVGNTSYVTGQDYSNPPSPKLYQVDRSANEVVDSVEVGGSPEGVAATTDRIFVALGGQDGSLAAVDPSSMEMTETIPVECDAPRSLALDQQNELLVFCSGSTIYDEDFNVVDRTNGAIRVVDPPTGSITERISLDTMLTSASDGQQVFYSSPSDEAFAVLAGGSILRFDAETNAIADQFSVSGDPVGAVGYDATDQRLYLGRPAASDPFGAEGTVTVHRRDGGQVASFSAGIAPAHIDFRRIEE